MFSKVTRSVDIDPRAVFRTWDDGVLTNADSLAVRTSSAIPTDYLNQAYWQPGDKTANKMITIGCIFKDVVYTSGGSSLFFTLSAAESLATVQVVGSLKPRVDGYAEVTFSLDRAYAEHVAQGYGIPNYLLGWSSIAAGCEFNYHAWIAQVLQA